MRVEDKNKVKEASALITKAQRLLSSIVWSALEGKEPGVLGSVQVYLKGVQGRLRGLSPDVKKVCDNSEKRALSQV